MQLRQAIILYLITFLEMDPYEAGELTQRSQRERFAANSKRGGRFAVQISLVPHNSRSPRADPVSSEVSEPRRARRPQAVIFLGSLTR
jgi:hypothetical protein